MGNNQISLTLWDPQTPHINLTLFSPCIVGLQYTPTSNIHKSRNTFTVHDSYNAARRYQYVKVRNLFQSLQGGTPHTHRLTCLFVTEIVGAVTSVNHAHMGTVMNGCEAQELRY